MVDIPVQSIGYLGSIASVAFTAGNAASGHDFTNTGDELLYVQNDGAGAVQVTVSSVPDPYDRLGDEVFSVAAGDRGIAGPFPPSLFNQPNGKVNVALDVDTSVTLAVLRFDRRKSVA